MARNPFKINKVFLITDIDKGMSYVTNYFVLRERFGNSLKGTEAITEDAGTKRFDIFYPFQGE